MGFRKIRRSGTKEVTNPKIRDHNPSEFFKHHEKVAEALTQSFEENDADAFLEILNTYLHINFDLDKC